MRRKKYTDYQENEQINYRYHETEKKMMDYNLIKVFWVKGMASAKAEVRACPRRERERRSCKTQTR